MSEKEPGYVSYLLRLWQAWRGGALIWHASLESPTTGERRGFASMADLFACLEQETAMDEDERHSLSSESADDRLGANGAAG
jgi:hypothetical protein